ncbi:hypothetical protein KY331_02090 [Candidatus Woesearchaeota archaeon]|nr:hypothetical protein [Candidatus Woesearchaeota archaeon]
MDTASCTILETVGKEHSPLEQLASSLMHLIAINPYVRISLNEHDNSVSISLKLRMMGRCEVFRIYDPTADVAERNVADNRVLIVDGTKHPRCYLQIRDFLEEQGYEHFHNPFEKYTRERWMEYQGL